jgi:hypothetical protein
VPAVKSLRTVPVVLVGLAVLVACGETDAPPPAASAPTSAAVSAAPSPSEATAPAGGENGDGKSDKERCQAIEAAGQKFKKDLLDLIKTGAPEDPATYAAVFTSFADGISKAGGTGNVGTAADSMVVELKKTAAAKDPANALDNPAMAKVVNEVEVACKTAGAPIKI